MATTRISSLPARYTTLNGKPLTSMDRVPLCDGAPQRMMSRLEHGLPHCIVEPQAGTRPQIQVVGNLPEEFYLRNGEKQNLSHRAKRVALAKTSTASMGWTLPLSYSEAKGKT